MSVTRLIRSWTEHTGRSAAIAGLMGLAVGMAGFSGQGSAQNLVTQNPNFSTEATGQTGSYNLSNTANNTTTLPGWTTNLTTSGDPSCLIAANSFTGCTGIPGTGVPTDSTDAPYIALMVDTGISSSIQQGVSLTAGQTYTLSFRAGAVENECVSPCTATTSNNVTWTVTIGGVQIMAPTFTVLGNATSGWQTETAIFTANSTEATSGLLKFLAGSSSSGPPIALLDSISLTKNSVPEPASLVLLGLGLAGLVGVRRRRSGAALAA